MELPSVWKFITPPPMPYMSSRALKGLRDYKYVAGGYTFLDRVHTPYWNKIVEYFPLWLAPNLITLIGTGWLVLAYFVTSTFLPDLKGPLKDPPPLVALRAPERIPSAGAAGFIEAGSLHRDNSTAVPSLQALLGLLLELRCCMIPVFRMQATRPGGCTRSTAWPCSCICTSTAWTASRRGARGRHLRSASCSIMVRCGSLLLHAALSIDSQKAVRQAARFRFHTGRTRALVSVGPRKHAFTVTALVAVSLAPHPTLLGWHLTCHTSQEGKASPLPTSPSLATADPNLTMTALLKVAL